MKTWYIAFKCFAVNFTKHWCRRKEYKTVTWNLAITETVTCIIKIETVMSIMYCRKWHLHTATETSTSIFSTKIITHIFAAETFNCIIPPETVTCIIIAEPQNLNNCNRRCHLHNCCRICQLHSSNRNCHLQNRLQKLSLAEKVTVRDSFSYNKEIEGMSKHQV